MTDLSGQKVILGGGTFVIPFVQKLATMDLRPEAARIQRAASIAEANARQDQGRDRRGDRQRSLRRAARAGRP